MGSPATISYTAPKTRARTINAPKSNINVNKALGLSSSPYQGLQQVGKQNLYYGDGQFYESYSPTATYYFRNNAPYGITQYYSSPYGLGGGSPGYHPIFGYSGGWQRGGGDVAGTIRRDGQAFKPSTNIPAGFIETDEGTYEPSVAYLYTSRQPNVRTQPNRMFTTVSGYTPARGGLLPAVLSGSDSGAGQYLGSSLLGGNISFSAPKASK